MAFSDDEIWDGVEEAFGVAKVPLLAIAESVDRSEGEVRKTLVEQAEKRGATIKFRHEVKLGLVVSHLANPNT